MDDRESRLKRQFDQRYQAEQAWRTQGTPAVDLAPEREGDQMELEIQNAELRYTHDELESQTALYWALYHSAPCGYFVLDGDGRISEVNQQGAAFLGKPRSDLLGRRLREYIEPVDGATFEEFAGRIWDTRERGECVLRLLHEGGEPFYGQLLGNRLGGSTAAQSRWLIVAFDVTQHVRATQAVSRARENVEEVNRCLLSLGDDYRANVARLVVLAGRLLGVDGAAYYSLEQGQRVLVARWIRSDEVTSTASAEAQGGELERKSRSDPGRRAPDDDASEPLPGIGSARGHSDDTQCGSRATGLLRISHHDAHLPTDHERRLVATVALALGVQEDRRSVGSQPPTAIAAPGLSP
jgi:PAS domain S-box-containing protein